MKLPVYFFGDNHFTPFQNSSNDNKIIKMREFFNKVKNSGGSIFILGDFFDYYFEYEKNNPNYYIDILSMLNEIKNSGIEIYFIAGNHDYWIGKELKNSTTECFLNDQLLKIGNKKIYLTHGDGILSWDKGYRFLKIILRSSIFRFLFSQIPKKIALKIAEKISYQRKDTHKVDKEKLKRIHNELINFSRGKWSQGCDIVIMGHYHHSFHFFENDKQLIIMDDCSNDKFNYAIFDGNSILINRL